MFAEHLLLLGSVKRLTEDQHGLDIHLLEDFEQVLCDHTQSTDHY